MTFPAGLAPSQLRTLSNIGHCNWIPASAGMKPPGGDAGSTGDTFLQVIRLLLFSIKTKIRRAKTTMQKSYRSIQSVISVFLCVLFLITNPRYPRHPRLRFLSLVFSFRSIFEILLFEYSKLSFAFSPCSLCLCVSDFCLWFDIRNSLVRVFEILFYLFLRVLCVSVFPTFVFGSIFEILLFEYSKLSFAFSPCSLCLCVVCLQSFVFAKSRMPRAERRKGL